MVLEKPEHIEEHILTYYEKLYNANSQIDHDSKSCYQKIKSNAYCSSIFRREEVKAAIFGINKYGAPSYDGFGGLFYKKNIVTTRVGIFMRLSYNSSQKVGSLHVRIPIFLISFLN